MFEHLLPVYISHGKESLLKVGTTKALNPIILTILSYILDINLVCRSNIGRKLWWRMMNRYCLFQDIQLWPEFDQSHALSNLRRNLSSLSQCLPPGILETDRERVGLRRIDVLWLDVEEFRKQLSRPGEAQP